MQNFEIFHCLYELLTLNGLVWLVLVLCVIVCPGCGTVDPFSITMHGFLDWLSVTILVVIPARNRLFEGVMSECHCIADDGGIHINFTKLSKIALCLLFHVVFGSLALAIMLFGIFMSSRGRSIPNRFTHKFNKKKTNIKNLSSCSGICSCAG